MEFTYQSSPATKIAATNKVEIKMEKEQYLTSSVYTFENMREGNFLYIDKTKYLWKIISKPQSMFFFSRPRRFGKSLTLSTLKAIFQGKKELFKDLYIENQPYDWKTYPVIHLDMGSVSADTTEKIEDSIRFLLNVNAENYNVELKEKAINNAFIELIQKLNKRYGKVVILIDEYDKPILNNIENENIEKFQTLIKGFYSVLKTCEPYERFVFITGVGKFLKVSIFSDLNNLSDISMHDDYATMCGYTEEELNLNFKERLIKLAEKKNTSYEELLKKIRLWYDGYRFSRNGENVYNPVSFTKFLENDGYFDNYWFETGSPSIIIKKISNLDFDIEKFLEKNQPADVFSAFSPSKLSVAALMYQTGYLTIKNVKQTEDLTFYKLGFPNFEVEQSFYRKILNNIDDYAGSSFFVRMVNAVHDKNIDEMMDAVNEFLSSIPYSIHINNEKYYQSIFFSIFKLIGTRIKAEVQTSDGRIDAVIEDKATVYLFEFKLNKSEETALEQILNKEYFKPFLNLGKKITLIGANFDFETKKLLGWKRIPL